MQSATPYFFSLVTLFSAAFSQAQSRVSLSDYGEAAEGEVRILRDSYGVPHIVSNDQVSLFFGAGYALAQDQLERLGLNYLSANGRAAEVLGADEVQNDTLVRLLQLPQRAAKGYASLSPDRRRLIDAYARGINRFIETADESQKPEWIEPISSEDVVAFGLYVNAMFAVNDCIRDLRMNGVQLSYTAPFQSQGTWGSNQFAIAPKKSATHSCMLSMDPHLRHSGFFLWHEMHLIGPEINVMGASLIGLPFVGMGRTVDTAWCMTVNGPDLGDIFVLEVDPKNPKRYKTPDGWEQFVARQEKLRIKAGNRFMERDLPILNSKFGPVITVQGNRAYAVKLSVPAGEDSIEQGFQMMVAKNLSEFKQALKLQGLLMFNILYGDRAGDIFFVSNGRVGKRSEEIDSHALRPAAEASSDWEGIHAFKELPQVENPSSGYLMNTNSGPQNTTIPKQLQPSDFPSYMIGHTDNSRSRRLEQLLKDDSSVTWQELIEYATDTKLEADDVLSKMFSLLEKRKPSSSEKQTDDILQVLEDWDRRADVASKGTVLFYYLINDQACLTALAASDASSFQQNAIQVGKNVVDQFGSLDVAWGEFSRIRRGDKELPMAGWPASGPVGSTLRPIGGRLNGNKHYCYGGSSYGMLVDFSGRSQSVSCLPFGVSGQPSSPNFDNMLPLYSQRKFKPTNFLPEDLRADIASEITLKP